MPLETQKPDVTVASGSIQSETVNETIRIGTTQYVVKQAAIDISGSGDATVVAAVPAKKIRVLALTFTVDGGNLDMSFKSGSNTKIDRMAFANRDNPFWNFMPAGRFVETNAGEALIFNLQQNRIVRGSVNYIEV